jgi:outer membrane protein OmpA-like peptidoglycan-associated protein
MRFKWLNVLLATTVLLFSFGLVVCATPTPQIESIVPNSGINNQVISVSVKGDHFYNRNTTVKLTKQGQPDIIASGVIVSKEEISCTLDLNGKTAGDWDLVVTNNGKVLKKHKIGVLFNGFKIVPPVPSIKSISPLSGQNNEKSLILCVKGANFRPDAQVALVNGNNSFPAQNNTINKTGDQIDATFNLIPVLINTYDVQVTNTDGTKAILPKSFKVIETPEPTPVPVPLPAPAPAPVPAPAPAPVDPNSLFKSIFFDFDQFVLRADQVDAIKANLEIVKKNNGFIVLGGHADERGPGNYNIQLSAKRAETVKRFFVMNGIDAKRIFIYAYGETSPAKLGHNEESWQFNRRVDIAIWAQVPNQQDALKK